MHLTQKTIGFGMSPPKLVKMVASVLCLNKSLLKGLSADDTKISLVAPLDQSTSKKNDIPNFRPVGVCIEVYNEVQTRELSDKVLRKVTKN